MRVAPLFSRLVDGRPASWRDGVDRHVATMTAVTWLEASPEAVFAFHADARNLSRLLPGPARLVRAPVPTRAGDRQIIRLGVRPFALEWHARITGFSAPTTLTDVQERGPFHLWRHTHKVLPARGGAMLVDYVEFRLLPGRLGRLADRLLMAPMLPLLFIERHRRT